MLVILNYSPLVTLDLLLDASSIDFTFSKVLYFGLYTFFLEILILIIISSYRPPV